jgi:hypothetical protein
LTSKWHFEVEMKGLKFAKIGMPYWVMYMLAMFFPQLFQNHFSPDVWKHVTRGTIYNFCLEIRLQNDILKWKWKDWNLQKLKCLIESCTSLECFFSSMVPKSFFFRSMKTCCLEASYAIFVWKFDFKMTFWSRNGGRRIFVGNI